MLCNWSVPSNPAYPPTYFPAIPMIGVSRVMVRCWSYKECAAVRRWKGKHCALSLVSDRYILHGALSPLAQILRALIFFL